ncbi:MAG: PadR family transcriptional regulator [Candidatus Hydrogenedentes bacterium]|nr:PadR family transcriptional regulator [Candidatus Hydrogenedentota bacterium]
MGNKPEPVDVENWTTQLRRGVLELSILNLLAQGEIYGYDLVKHLAKVKGLVVTEGTVYPLMSRLKRMGLVKTRLVESTSGPVRKYYTLSAEGRKMRATMNAHWDDLTRGVALLRSEGEEQS